LTRLLFSIALALAVHGLIFCLNGEWLKNRPYHQIKQSPVTISLTYLPSIVTAADSQSIQTHEKKTVDMPENELDKKNKVIDRPVSRSEHMDTSTQTDIPAASGVIAANAVTDPLPYMVDKGYREGGPINGLEGLKQAYDHTAGAMPPVSRIIKEAVPLYKENPAPGYPMQAKKNGYEGTVVLEVLVTKDGKAGKVSVFQSSRYSLLDEAAMSSVKKWRFEPGKRGDEKVDMPVKIPIRFKLETD
jgi:TonB family protein